MKYKVIKPVEHKNWEVGDIVMVSGDIEESGILEKYEGTEPHKHTLVVVDTVSLLGKLNKNG
jgi:hypothetical protein